MIANVAVEFDDAAVVEGREMHRLAGKRADRLRLHPKKTQGQTMSELDPNEETSPESEEASSLLLVLGWPPV